MGDIYLFVSEISSGPKAPEDFAEPLNRLRMEGFVAAAWFDYKVPEKMIIVGWAETLPVEKVQEVFRAVEWRAETRAFAPMRFGPFPGPGTTITYCGMPYNAHQIISGTKVCTQQGHTFCDNHNIQNCALCGGLLQ